MFQQSARARSDSNSRDRASHEGSEEQPTDQLQDGEVQRAVRVQTPRRPLGIIVHGLQRAVRIVCRQGPGGVAVSNAPLQQNPYSTSTVLCRGYPSCVLQARACLDTRAASMWAGRSAGFSDETVCRLAAASTPSRCTACILPVHSPACCKRMHLHSSQTGMGYYIIASKRQVQWHEISPTHPHPRRAAAPPASCRSPARRPPWR